MTEIWKSWSEVKDICRNKKVFLFGRSDDWIPKTVYKLDYVKELVIIDNNISYENTEFCGVKVLNPKILLNENINDIYVIITAGPYESVAEELIALGFRPSVNFCCTPEMKDWGLLQQIRDYDTNIIISCCDYSEKSKKRHSKLGGGLYLYNTSKNFVEKKVNGHFRQIIEVDNNYFVVEFVEKKIYVIDKKFNILKKHNLDQTDAKKEKPNGCGIAFCKKRNLFFVINAGSDEISIYEKNNFKFINKIKFSDKYDKFGDGQHHLNDLTVIGDSLIITYFSFSGSWKKGGMDGGVCEIDLNDPERKPQPIFHDLWMPHSPEFIDGQICVLDSMRGSLWVGNKRKEGTFQGFVRGLTYDGRYYFIGQSEDMYTSRLFGLTQNIICNAGFYMFDVEKKVSRFYSLPDIMNIHDLCIYKS